MLKKVRFSLVFSILTILVLVLAACSSASSATPAATTAPAATAVPTVVAPTQVSLATSGLPSTGATATPLSSTSAITPSVTVNNQPIVNGTVTIASITYAQMGWLVIHNNANGAPGADIGVAPVYPGTNTNVVVPIDVTRATPVLYAMLHTDVSIPGKYEFPGPDTPVFAGKAIVTPSFNIQGSIPGQNTPGLDVLNQPVVSGTVNVPDVISSGPGWLVIHADNNGAPGADLGHAPVKAGLNFNVEVQIDTSKAPVGSKVWAMLHTDAGVMGKYEFPGPDVPILVNGKIVQWPFTILAGFPAPVTSASAPSATQAPTVAAAPGAQVTVPPNTVDMIDLNFIPNDLTVKVNTTITWINQSQLPHTVTSDTGIFDSGNINPGGKYSFTFNKSGTYAYHCSYHGKDGGIGMAGTIVVTP